MELPSNMALSTIELHGICTYPILSVMRVAIVVLALPGRAASSYRSYESRDRKVLYRGKRTRLLITNNK